MYRSLVMSNTFNYITQEEATELASKIFSMKCLKIVDFRTAPFSTEKLGYLSEHTLLTILLREKNKSCELNYRYTFFVKSLATRCSDFNKHVFHEESHFYSNFIPLLRDFDIESWTPKCYLVKKNVFILEDLRSQGFYAATEKFTLHQLKIAISAVARFHASSILLEHQLKVPLTVAFPGFFEAKAFKNDNGRNLKFLTAGMEVAESIASDLGLDPKYVTMAYDVVIQGDHLMDNEWNVLCHQDLWINNMMFSRDDKYCRLLDFQMVAYGSFATDVVQLLYLNLDRETRLKFENLSLEIYHSVLEKTLVLNGISNDKIISSEKVHQTVENKRIYGLFAAVQLGPIVLLNKQFARAYSKDPIIYQSYNSVCRRDFVKKVMQSDQNYRRRLEKSVKELVDYMKNNKFE